MTILPSASLRNQYSEISERCKATGEPIYLTKNGDGDTIVVYDVVDSRKDNSILKL